MAMSKALWMSVVLATAMGTGTGLLGQESKPADPAKPAEPAKPDPTDPNVKRDVSHYNLGKDKGKPAISGYDPVSYFADAPKKGVKEHAYVYRGVTYWFATRENLETFKKDPSKYEPAYGGWCAYAMGATGEKVDIDPLSFKITGGRLFLFYKDFFNDTRAKWSKEEPSLRGKADTNWKKTSGEAVPAAR